MRAAGILTGCLAPVTAIVVLAGCDEPASPDAGLANEESAADAFDLSAVQGPMVPFADLVMFFEFNSTDNDLGVQVMLDAEGWNLITAESPDRRNILHITARNELGSLGITELRFESAEPSPAGVLRRFPPGAYHFRGLTVERGGVLDGVAMLSHDIPTAPVMSPEDGAADIDPANTIIAWNAIPGLAGFEVIVANEDTGRSMTVELGPDATMLRVPAEFMEPDTDYKAEVLAIHTNGNKTITEATFSTGS